VAFEVEVGVHFSAGAVIGDDAEMELDGADFVTTLSAADLGFAIGVGTLLAFRRPCGRTPGLERCEGFASIGLPATLILTLGGIGGCQDGISPPSRSGLPV
jgi:hypothetical protein